MRKIREIDDESRHDHSSDSGCGYTLLYRPVLKALVPKRNREERLQDERELQ